MSDSRAAQAPFRHTTRIRFHAADPAAVLFFGGVFALVHDAYEDLLRSGGFTYEEWFGPHDYLLPVVHAEADYKRSMDAGEELTVLMGFERVGRSSLTYSFSVIGTDGNLRVHGRIVHACVDAATFSSMPLPDSIRPRLEALAARHPAPTPGDRPEGA